MMHRWMTIVAERHVTETQCRAFNVNILIGDCAHAMTQ
jgi:hypothetical protein